MRVWIRTLGLGQGALRDNGDRLIRSWVRHVHMSRDEIGQCKALDCEDGETGLAHALVHEESWIRRHGEDQELGRFIFESLQI